MSRARAAISRYEMWIGTSGSNVEHSQRNRSAPRAYVMKSSVHAESPE